MMRVPVLVLFFVASLTAARAVVDVENNSLNESPPSNSQITNWNSGWAQPTNQPTGYTNTTGWNYVGMVNGNSAVYLGNGVVLTAAHVGANSFVLDNVIYPMVPGSAQIISSVQIPGQGAPVVPNADLLVFQISPYPALPPLTIRSSVPKVAASEVVLIGYGETNGDRGETWGYNTVSDTNIPVALTNNGSAYYSTDFLTETTNGFANPYQIIEGDSGGGDFIYNSTTRAWELAGVNEAILQDTLSNNYSGMVQLNWYATQVNTSYPLANTPTVPPWGLVILAVGLLVVASRVRPQDHLPDNASSKG